jgi:hypothetical protein
MQGRAAPSHIRLGEAVVLQKLVSVSGIARAPAVSSRVTVSKGGKAAVLGAQRA